MPGRPVTRARKAAEARLAAEALFQREATFADNPVQAMADMQAEARRAGNIPPAPSRDRTPVQATRDLYAKLLRGSDDAIESILNGAAPRDAQALAAVATQLLRAARELEPEVGEHDDPAKLAAEARALEEELRRRG